MFSLHKCRYLIGALIAAVNMGSDPLMSSTLRAIFFYWAIPCAAIVVRGSQTRRLTNVPQQGQAVEVTSTPKMGFPGMQPRVSRIHQTTNTQLASLSREVSR